jgi:hypothetical protein
VLAQIVIAAQDKASGVFDTVANKANGLGQTYGKLMGLLSAGGSVAYLANLVHQSIQAADAANDLSTATGVAVETITGYSVAAKTVGMSNEDLAKGFNKLTVAQVDADTNTEKYSKTFGRLGVTLRDQSGALKATDALINDVADAFGELEDGPTKTALGIEIFGKSWLKMAPLLAMGSEGLEDARQIAEDLGLVLDKKTADAAGRTADLFDILGMSGQGMGNQLMAKVLPTVEGLAQMFLEGKRSGGMLDQAMDGLVIAFKGVVSGGLIVTEVLKSLGTIAGGVVSAVMRAMSGDFSGAASAMSGAFTAVKKSNDELDGTLTKLWDDTLPKVSNGALDVVKKKRELEKATTDNTRATKAESDGLEALEKAQRATALAMGQAAIDRAKTEADAFGKMLAQQHSARLLSDGEYYDARARLSTETNALQMGQIASMRATEQTAYDEAITKASATGLALKDKNKILQDAEGIKQKLIKLDNDEYKLAAEKLTQEHAWGAEVEANWIKADEAARSNARSLIDQKQSLADSVDEAGRWVAQLGLAPSALERINSLRSFDKDTAKLRLQLERDLYDVEQDREQGRTASKEALARIEINTALVAQRSATRAALDAQMQLNEATREQMDVLGRIQGLVGGIWDAWASGKSLIKTLGDTLKKEIGEYLKELATKRVVIPIIGSMLGMSGSAIAGVTGGPSSLLGSLMGSAGGGGMGGMLGTAMGAMGSFGSGLGAGFGALLGESGLMGALSMGTTAIGAGGIAAGLGTLAGALGPLALGVMALAGLDNKGGGPKTEGGYATGGGLLIRRGGVADAEAATSARAIAAQYSNIMRLLGKQAGTLDAAVQFSMDNGAGGDANTQLQVAASLNGRSVFNLNPSYLENIGRGSDALKEAITRNSLRAVVEALRASDLDGASASFVAQIDTTTSSVDALQNALSQLTSLTAAAQAVEGFGGVFTRFGQLSIEARNSFTGLVGGVEAFVAKAQGFVANYYSESEQNALTAQRVSGSLSAAGISTDLRDRAGLRSLLDRETLDTPESRARAAALLNVQGDFARLADYLGTQNTSLQALAAQAPVTALANTMAASAQDAQAAAAAQAQMQTDMLQVARDQLAAAQAASQAQIEALVRVITNTGDTARALDQIARVGITTVAA